MSCRIVCLMSRVLSFWNEYAQDEVMNETFRNGEIAGCAAEASVVAASQAFSALDLLPDLICVVGVDGFYEHFNRAWRRNADVFTAGFESECWADNVHVEDRALVRHELEVALSTGRPCNLDMRLIAASGVERWYLLRAHPELDERGQVRFWLYILTDIQDRKISRLNLSRRIKLQTEMLNISQDCIKILTVDGRLQHMNRAGCLALNVDEDSGFGMEWLPLLPDEVHAEGEKALREAQEGRHARFPGLSCMPGESVRCWDNMLTPCPNEQGDVEAILCVSRDVTAQREGERRVELLLHELNHRSKNMLAVVLALIRRSVPDPKADFVKVLEQRLVSISRSQDLLVAGELIGVTVRDLVLSQTAVAGDMLEERIIVKGDPSLRLRVGAAEMVGLAMHELTTNAIKYGALSNDLGTVNICWNVQEMPEGSFFRLIWEESGGPEVKLPERRGFGTAVIGRNPFASQGGSLQHVFEPSGVLWELKLPVESGLASAN